MAHPEEPEGPEGRAAVLWFLWFLCVRLLFGVLRNAQSFGRVGAAPEGSIDRSIAVDATRPRNSRLLDSPGWEGYATPPRLLPVSVSVAKPPHPPLHPSPSTEDRKS